MAPNPRARARGGAERRAPPADRPAIRATRWRRLLAAVADSVLAKFGWGRTLELGRSLRTLMMLRPPVVCDSTPVQTTALRGLMASLALTGASLWRAMSMRDRPAGCASCAGRLCGALRGSGRPPRGGRRRSFVGGDRLLVVNGRCWRRRGSAPRAGAGVRWRRRATAQQRATNTTLAATRRHR